ncbi:hypothetical protein POTOM_052204 [Populus tomentosa]|uniref:Cation-transporting P-type ATPase C-terminal domain-containing protein n=1 Tax=Populus tomentosa TaxID=118781 RepID=A0A8X7Y7K4_POPTO|nr:hypothetical protein POTOM_052204 [Populus tomentosa]
MKEEMPFLMALCVAYWKRKIMSSGCKGIVQKSSACLTMGFVTTICTDLARKLASQDELEETRKAIRDCQTAGVNVKFISQDDNISVLRAAAIEFGILTENSEAAMLKGEDFRNFSEEERTGMVDQTSRHWLCEGRLEHKNGKRLLRPHGRGWNLEPSSQHHKMRSMLIRKHSEIHPTRANHDPIWVIDNYHLNNTIRRSSYDTNSVSWTNLIVPVLGGMAVITEPPGEKLMNRPPVQKTEPLITKAMRRNIIAQVVYQVVIFVMVQFKGQVIYGTDRKLRKAMMFNSFVLLQVFNQFNSREIEKVNVFKNIHQNYW